MRELSSANKISSGTIVITHEQKKGKGLRGNQWLSKPGMNLTFSFFIDDLNLDTQQTFIFSEFIALTLFDFFENLQIPVKIKWPNDIYHKDSKIAGILIENQIKNNEIKSSIVGIGVNVNQVDFGRLNATSIKKITQTFYPMEDILEKYISSFNQLSSLFHQKENIKQKYLEHLYRFNEWHPYKDLIRERIIQGKIIDVENEGNLVVKTKDKEILRFDLKEIEFVI